MTDNLQELRDKGELDEIRKNDLDEAHAMIEAILRRTNEHLARQDRLEAVQALRSQVEDWRNHRIEAFGDLLLYGTHTVIKGDGMNSEREVFQSHVDTQVDTTNLAQYRMYLFEKILLCCKELGPKQMAKVKYKSTQSHDKKGRPRMALKGRIFMQNVTETVYLTTASKRSHGPICKL